MNFWQELGKKLLNSLNQFYSSKMAIVRIKLSSIDTAALNKISEEIKEIAGNAGVSLRGPIPMPTKRLKITTRKSPCGDGTATFDRFEMRIRKRIIDLPANDRVLHAVMKLPIPRSVNIKIEMKD